MEFTADQLLIFLGILSAVYVCIAILLHRSVPYGVVQGLNEAQAAFSESARRTPTPVDDIAAGLIKMFTEYITQQAAVEYVVEEYVEEEPNSGAVTTP